MKLRNIILGSILFLSVTLTAQERIYFPFFELLNVNSEYQYSSSRLFSSYVNQSGLFLVVLPQKSDSIVIIPDVLSVKNRAKELNANFYMMGELNSIGNVLAITMSMFSVETGKLVWFGRQNVNQLEDLNNALYNLSNDVKITESITNTTDDKKIKLRQNRSISNNFGGFVGGGFFPSYNGINNRVPAGFGLRYSLTHNKLIMDITVESYRSDLNFSVSGITVSRVCCKLFGTKIYCGGGLGVGIFDVDNGGDNGYSNEGLALNGNIGVILNDNYKGQVRVETSFISATAKLNSEIPYGCFIKIIFLLPW